MDRYDKLVPDTSIIVDSILSQKIIDKEIVVDDLLISHAVLAELEHQANMGKATGFLGLDEIKKLQVLAKKNGFTLRFAGKRPSFEEIRHADLGEVDAGIRQLAWEEGAVLYTADHVQARVAEARGMRVVLEHKELNAKSRSLLIEKYFDDTTMSVHLRENVTPFAKRGKPGVWDFVKLSEKLLTEDDLKAMSSEIINEASTRKDSFLDSERPGSTIVQLDKYRIVILRPPFSDAWEITAVRPVKHLDFSDYALSEKLKQRVAERAEGVLIAGAPGQGKSTFAQALATLYASKGKIVKTIEAPRDLVVPDTITQLAMNKGTTDEIHDILLLTRPDYTLFDEMRNTKDFALFADLRLAGVGMVGVLHATKPLDAIQRFIGRIDLGVIPHVIDTILFVNAGTVSQVLGVSMIVKVPEGMTEADLARPVVVVQDFETNKPVAEIYTYGEETVVIPVSEQTEQAGVHKLAGESIKRVFRRFADDVQVEVTGPQSATVIVPEKYIGSIIGREGKTISRIQEELGMHIDVREKGTQNKQEKTESTHDIPQRKGTTSVAYEVDTAGKFIQFFVGNMHNKDVHLYVGDDFIATFKVGKKGIISIKKTNQLGKTVTDALDDGERIRFVA